MSSSVLVSAVKQFIQTLSATQFQGEIEVSEVAKLVHSVDNSIYEVKPAAVIYPKNSD